MTCDIVGFMRFPGVFFEVNLSLVFQLPVWFLHKIIIVEVVVSPFSAPKASLGRCYNPREIGTSSPRAQLDPRGRKSHLVFHLPSLFPSLQFEIFGLQMEKSDTGADHNESMEPLNASPIEAVENSGTIQNSKEQSLSSKDENAVPNELSHDSNAIDPSTDVPLRSLNNNLGQDPAYPTNVYAPQAQTFVYGGYDNTKWEEYPPHFFHAEGMEGGSTGIYNENQSVMFHTGFGYNPHMPYGPYSPVTTPLPAPGGDGQLYSTQNFHFTGPYYQQPTPSNMPYLHTPTPKSQTELTMAFDRQDWLKSPDGSGSLTPLLSPAASPQPTSVVRSFGLIDLPFASGMNSHCLKKEKRKIKKKSVKAMMWSKLNENISRMSWWWRFEYVT
ncbi:hypothetical protein HPP92_003751 [Vanilla planifolia]|uniref:Uncharacterized protein n=1 Tax=Vanilla planifolia TaxID=51239 RepID=A0A835VJ91_VANPL|nr:hypothetical protein HPP92_003751 [Vanilla planifolia]